MLPERKKKFIFGLGAPENKLWRRRLRLNKIFHRKWRRCYKRSRINFSHATMRILDGDEIIINSHDLERHVSRKNLTEALNTQSKHLV